MFQQTLLPDHHGARKPLGVLFSISLQAFALASIILVQLFYVPPVPTVQLRALLAGPPPPVSQPKVQTAAPPRTVTPNHRIFVLQAPVTIPRQINPSADYEAPTLPDTGIVGTVANTAGNNDLLNGFGKVMPAPPPPKVEPKPVSTHTPMRMGGAVAAANIIHQVQPVYPAMARSARVEGTVEYTAVIDKSGRVVNLQLRHGHPLLVNAAQEAILQWRYKPTMLNGEPVDVVTTITVNFKLSSN